jgi:predicted Zn-dependent peptidase
MREEIRFLEELASTFVVSNEMDALLSGAGARGLNATTSEESTTYYVEIPANRAELWFALEGDRMANPVFREFYAERDVVAEERRLRLETNSGGVLYEAHMAAAFRVHPYGKPVIGSMADLQRLTRRQVEGHFRRYYGPGNAVVAVVGAVDPDQIARWARRYLGPLSSGEPPPPVLAREPEQVGERRVEVAFDAEPLLRLGWRIPPVDHEDGPALAVLSSVLAGGRSSRLYRRLILEDRIASGVVATMGPGRLYPGLFSVDATPRSPHTAAEVEAAIYQELERLAASPPDLSELEGIRNQLEAAEVRRLRSNLGLALQLAESASLLGEWDAGFRFNARMQEVAPEDIQRVARAYFAPEGRTVATLVKPGVPSPDPGARRTP